MGINVSKFDVWVFTKLEKLNLWAFTQGLKFSTEWRESSSKFWRQWRMPKAVEKKGISDHKSSTARESYIAIQAEHRNRIWEKFFSLIIGAPII
jgi:hypothetical protein